MVGAGAEILDKPEQKSTGSKTLITGTCLYLSYFFLISTWKYFVHLPSISRTSVPVLIQYRYYHYLCLPAACSFYCTVPISNRLFLCASCVTWNET
jgi:hypothetical protein